MVDAPSSGLASVGKPLLRVDAVDKVSGRALYLHDLAMEGVAHTSLVRSTSPHAAIRRIATGAAREASGVLAVVTGADLASLMAEPYWGPAVLDQSPLAIGRVRYVGEPVAAVVAESQAEAAAAAELVEVDYDELPAVFDPILAMLPDAPLIHETARPSRAFADLAKLRPAEATNVNMHFRLRKGDVDAALAAADFVFARTYSYPRNQFCALEPHLTVARVDADDSITVWSTTQSPHIVRGFLSAMFGVPLDRVRVIVGYLGGGYGGKTYMKLEPLAAALAKYTGRPVRVGLRPEEEFLLVNNHAAIVRMRTGVTKEGRLVAAESEVVWDSGAHADIGPRIAQKSGATATGPYDVPNVRIDSYSVYTNLPPTGPVRGFGIPQIAWAYESHMDVVARELGLDPLAFRRRNLLQPGRTHPTGTVMRGVDFHSLLDAVAEGLGEDRAVQMEPVEGSIRRGRGFAVALKAVLTPSRSEARVAVDTTGAANVYTSAVEMGQGTTTVLTQIVAEGLGVATGAVRVVPPDTDVAPYDLIAAGSRSTHHIGRAALDAACAVRKQLIAAAAEFWDEDPGAIAIEDGEAVKRDDPLARIPIGEVVHRIAGRSGRVEASGAYQTDYEYADLVTGQSATFTNHWMSGAVGAEVEVDPETGRVLVRRLAVAGDAGRAINPENCHSQLGGAAVMGLGHALMERVVFEDGQVANGSFAEYLIPSMKDIPVELTTRVLENEAVGGPFGAKGIGESGILAVAPAIANAVADAVGVRICELPITAERVHAALRQAEDGGPEPAGDSRVENE